MSITCSRETLSLQSPSAINKTVSTLHEGHSSRMACPEEALHRMLDLPTLPDLSSVQSGHKLKLGTVLYRQLYPTRSGAPRSQKHCPAAPRAPYAASCTDRTIYAGQCALDWDSISTIINAACLPIRDLRCIVSSSFCSRQ